MNIEDLLKRNELDEEKLLEYGFQRKDKDLLYQTKILNDTFHLTINITKNKQVKMRGMDLETNYEYTLERIENQTGSFVSSLKKEIESIVTDIVEKCAKPNKFLTDQANRLAAKIEEKYQSVPEFLWQKYPGYAIFRNKENNKWYAAIMNILKEKLDEGSYEVEIIDVKLTPEKIQSLLTRKGFYEAYHMNKKSWITILLDDTISDGEIMSYVEESYELTKKKK